MKFNTKRILSFALSAIFVCSGVQSVSAEKMDKLEQAKNLLSALSVVETDTNAIVTREQFADIFIRANNLYQEGYVGMNPFDDTTDSEYADSIELMRDYGYISGVGNNCFAPNENILTKDIAKLYVTALGLDFYSGATGKDYMQIAYEVKLFDGVRVSDYITMDNLILMTYNFLNAPVGAHDLSGQISYSINYDTDALYEKFDVVKISGQVTQNDLSGIWSTDAAREGYVVIKTDDAEITALAGESGIDFMLGYTLDIYLYEGKEDYKVICYEEKTNEQSVVINLKNIDFDNSDNETIRYIKDGKKTVTTAKLASFPTFIINNVYYDAGQFDIGMLRNYSGQMKLIASDRSLYDVVIVEAYTNYFVDNVEHYNGEMRVYDSGSNETLILDDTVYEKMEIYYPNGASASPFELQEGMLLSVAKSFGSETCIRIYISDTIEEGKISGYREEDEVLEIDNDITYPISPSYRNVSISVGSEAKVYIDKFGEVAWIEYDKTATYSYAFMRKAVLDEDENKVMVKVVVESGKFSTMYLAEKVKIDGLRVKNPIAQVSELESIEKFPNLVAGEYPFRYRLNEAGEMKEIDTPSIRLGYEEKDSFRLTESATDVICSNDRILGKKTPLSANTVMFLIPEATATEEREEPSFYQVGNSSLVNTGGENTYTAFKIGNDSLYADLVIRTQRSIGGGLGHDNTLFLVDKIQEVYDEKNDETRIKVFGLEAGVPKEYFLHEQCNKDKVNGIGQGDVVRFAFYSGEIVAIDKVFIYEDDKETYTGKYHLPTRGQQASSLAQIGTSYYYAGYVMCRDGRLIEILPFDLSANSQDTGTLVPNYPDWSIEDRRVFQAPTKISIYDPSLGTKGAVYAGDLEDIPSFENGGNFVKVIVRYRSRSAQEMVVLKDRTLF